MFPTPFSDWALVAIVCIALIAGILIGYEAGKFVALAIFRSQGEDRTRSSR